MPAIGSFRMDNAAWEALTKPKKDFWKRMDLLLPKLPKKLGA